MPNDPSWNATYEAAGASHRGLHRAQNEDSYALRFDPSHGAGNFAVCDGMGGAAAGELASRIAAETVIREMSALSREDLASGCLQQAVSTANLNVYSRAGSDKALAGMGTTLVALAVRGSRAWIANVGDSRCYRWRGGRLEQLTRDHSLVDEQVRRGQLTPLEAASSPLRSVITRAVGTEPEVLADLLEMEVTLGDMYLLVSDGLIREVSDQGIAEILHGGGQPAWLCAQLIEGANRAGGSDNITCIVVRSLNQDVR